MIRVPTTFVIGAGASAELDFPTGPGLLRDISELLQFGSQFDHVNGSSAALDIGLAYARLTGQSRINPSDPFYDAAARVRSAADIARSIDNVIDQNDDDPLVEMVGKLAIAYRLLTAEAESKLSEAPEQPGIFDLQNLRDTWLLPLGQMLTTDIRKSRVESIFDQLTIITFNYDRSIEAYLPTLLVAAYGLDHADAVAISQRVRIFHPYGQVGRLSWDLGVDGGIPYGWVARDRLELIAPQLRTFTEQLADGDELTAMRNAVQQAEHLVFLGFGFHRQNMRLLAPDMDAQSTKIIGSLYREPGPARETIVEELRRLTRPLGATMAIVPTLPGMTCTDLLTQYFLPLTSG
ncbi:hypothetical protein QLH51_17955 [Sphingomonas sp. 2R-10]|uniref:hypothetical protein n=1 Tax=Sphingomonas sp. 2R-10 TaxID=3045148 RepID=UPI000F7AE1D9|nr:hypothetical protein [Sphingomonas sp. 2R-10]MDJ0278681.1 hypothetical protein [Sphingomonas sp. 2R-10]